MSRWFRTLVWGVCAAAIFASLAYWPVQVARHGASWLDYVDDDAFYYFVIAKNIAAHHLSSFDGTTLTNGYQPLWQIVLAVQALVFPDSFSATVFIEVAAAAAASMLALRLIEPRALWLLPLFAALLLRIVRYSLVLDGMEVSLLFLAFSAFALALAKAFRSPDSWLPMAICGGFVVATRLDVAVFVLPAVLLVPSTHRQRQRALVLLVICGLLYVVGNKLVFDAWMPVSGSIKSLGGFGLNRPFLQQMAEEWPAKESLARAALDFVRNTPGRTCLLAILTAILIVACPRDERLARKLAIAILLGALLFAARILFLSSWRIWGWYYYPIFFLFVADLLLVSTILGAPSSRLGARLVACAALAALIGSMSVFGRTQELITAALLFAIVPLAARGPRAAMLGQMATVLLGAGLLGASVDATLRTPPNRPVLYGEFARILAEKVRAITSGAPVAMGDRAGSFAYFYGGPVHQLEGLVNDSRYLERVKDGRPIEPLLCQRGVRYVLAWENDLGNYSSHVFHVYRAPLTRVEGPTINVNKSDEVMRLDESNGFADNVHDRYVYLWKLDGCGGN